MVRLFLVGVLILAACGQPAGQHPPLPDAAHPEGPGADGGDGGDGGGGLDAGDAGSEDHLDGGTTPDGGEEGPRTARCDELAEPADFSAEEYFSLGCVNPDALLDDTPNFVMFGRYLGGNLDTRGGPFGLAEPGDGGWRAAAQGAFDSRTATADNVVFSGQAEGGLPASLRISKSARLSTGLRCAELSVDQVTVQLSCFVQPDTARGLCGPFAFPGEDVLTTGRHFIVSFLGHPSQQQVDSIRSAIEMNPLVEQVEQISSPPVAVLTARFDPLASFADRHRVVTREWCGLSGELQVFPDSEVGPD
jgi:hypothetical protein